MSFGSFFKKIFRAAAPIVGYALGGPVGSAIGGAVGGAAGGGGVKGALIGGGLAFAGAKLAPLVHAKLFGSYLGSSGSAIGLFGKAGIPTAGLGSSLMNGVKLASAVFGAAGGGKTRTVIQKTAVPAAPGKSDPAATLAAEEERKRLLIMGRSSTIRTSNRGVIGDDRSSGLATKKLLG